MKKLDYACTLLTPVCLLVLGLKYNKKVVHNKGSTVNDSLPLQVLQPYMYNYLKKLTQK